MLRSVFTIFFRAPGTRPWLVLGCLFAGGLAGGIGFASLLPLFSLAANASGEGGSESLANQFILEFLEALGLTPTLLPLLTLLVIALVAKNILVIGAMSYAGSTAASVAAGLRSELIKKLLRVRWAYLASQPLGRFTNAVSVDATRGWRAYLVSANFFSNALQAMIYVTVALFISWRLSVLAIVTGLVIALLLQVFVRISRKAGLKQTQRTAELVTYLSDALISIKPLKAMARQDGFANLFDRKIDSLRRTLKRQVLSKEMRRGLEQILTVFCVAFLFYAAVSIWGYELPEVIVMGVLMLQGLKNIGKVQETLQEAVVLESPYFAVRDLIDEAEAAREPLDGGQVPSFEQGVRFSAVDFSFGDMRVLERLDLDLPRGQLTVLTGPSGTGKTTVSDLLLGLYEPDGGEILVDGVPLGRLDKSAWRNMIGYVPQELILFHDTIFANVALGDSTITEAAVNEALTSAGARDFVAALPAGVETVVGEKGAKLSGGQRQRVALARALVTHPKLLILDEVTSALDPATEADLCRRLRPLTADMAVLAITHRLSFLDIADRAYRLEDGQLTELAPSPANSLARRA